jgi:hypothetical protein
MKQMSSILIAQASLSNAQIVLLLPKDSFNPLVPTAKEKKKYKTQVSQDQVPAESL